MAGRDVNKAVEWLLVDRGFDLGIKDSPGRTAPHRAAE